MARNKFHKYGSAYWEENRVHRNKVVAIRKTSIAKYFSQKCSSHDKSFWSTVSPFMTDKKHRNGNSFMLQENDKTVVDDKLVANIFNDYFCNIASKIGFDDPITTTHSVINKHRDHRSVLKIRETYYIEADFFSFSCVDENAVTSELRSIKINKGPGYDCIPGKLLRLAHEVLSPHFTYMLNECITRSVFPSNMKNAELSPLYKREDQLNKVNYRPVSLLTVISKICESVMFDHQVSDYFGSIFEDLLCAFRKKYSCQSTLIKTIDDWKVSLDRNQMIGAVFTDLSKAFDCLPHGLIIAKLHEYGLSLDACDLFSSYLCNRFQRVKVKTSRSEWAVIKKGIPQGSILGPLLFNVFVNDMFHFMENVIFIIMPMIILYL